MSMNEPAPNPAALTNVSPNGAAPKSWLLADESSSARSDVALRRRDQIMDAAEAIIAGEGIHKLSLGRIEERLGGMSRGQLTYYFPSKESILLAVYERMIRRIIAQLHQDDGP